MSTDSQAPSDDDILAPIERIAYMIERVRESAWSTAYDGRVTSIRAKSDHLGEFFEKFRRGTLESAPRRVDANIGEHPVIFFHAGAPKGEERRYEGSPGPMKTEQPLRRPLRPK